MPSFAGLLERWTIVQREMRPYLETLTDDSLNGTIRYVIPGALREHVVWHILLDAFIIHGGQHRSEAAALLTDYGQSPGDFDFSLFLNERA